MEKRQVYCNICGKTIQKVNGVLREDALFVKKQWGYFSKKDLQIHEFVICENCYDKMIREFQIPPTISEKNEVMSEEEAFS